MTMQLRAQRTEYLSNALVTRSVVRDRRESYFVFFEKYSQKINQNDFSGEMLVKSQTTWKQESFIVEKYLQKINKMTLTSPG